MTKDFSRLSGKIVEKYGTQYNFAIAIGLSERSLSLKLNNRVGWRDEEIERAVQLLGLDINDIPAYFFTKAVQVSWANFVRKEDGMNELERTALNEILRTVTYIAEKVDELDSKISLSINDNQEKKFTDRSKRWMSLN